MKHFAVMLKKQASHLTRHNTPGISPGCRKWGDSRGKPHVPDDWSVERDDSLLVPRSAACQCTHSDRPAGRPALQGGNEQVNTHYARLLRNRYQSPSFSEGILPPVLSHHIDVTRGLSPERGLAGWRKDLGGIFEEASATRRGGLVRRAPVPPGTLSNWPGLRRHKVQTADIVRRHVSRPSMIPCAATHGIISTAVVYRASIFVFHNIAGAKFPSLLPTRAAESFLRRAARSAAMRQRGVEEVGMGNTQCFKLPNECCERLYPACFRFDIPSARWDRTEWQRCVRYYPRGPNRRVKTSDMWLDLLLSLQNIGFRCYCFVWCDNCVKADASRAAASSHDRPDYREDRTHVCVLLTSSVQLETASGIMFQGVAVQLRITGLKACGVHNDSDGNHVTKRASDGVSLSIARSEGAELARPYSLSPLMQSSSPPPPLFHHNTMEFPRPRGSGGRNSEGLRRLTGGRTLRRGRMLAAGFDGVPMTTFRVHRQDLLTIYLQRSHQEQSNEPKLESILLIVEEFPREEMILDAAPDQSPACQSHYSLCQCSQSQIFLLLVTSLAAPFARRLLLKPQPLIHTSPPGSVVRRTFIVAGLDLEGSPHPESCREKLGRTRFLGYRSPDLGSSVLAARYRITSLSSSSAHSHGMDQGQCRPATLTRLSRRQALIWRRRRTTHCGPLVWASTGSASASSRQDGAKGLHCSDFIYYCSDLVLDLPVCVVTNTVQLSEVAPCLTPVSREYCVKIPYQFLGATVAELLACSPSTKANRVQSQTGSPDFRKWESCQTMPLAGGFFLRDFPFPHPSISTLLHTHLNHPHQVSWPKSLHFTHLSSPVWDDGEWIAVTGYGSLSGGVSVYGRGKGSEGAGNVGGVGVGRGCGERAQFHLSRVRETGSKDPRTRQETEREEAPRRTENVPEVLKPRPAIAIAVFKTNPDIIETNDHYYWGLSGVVRLLAYQLCEPGSIPGGVAPGFSHVGIVPDDTAGQRVFSGVSRFPQPFHSDAALWSAHSTFIGYEDLDVKSCLNLFPSLITKLLHASGEY
ncbi:hypothetical protein PR048_025418 [Dryococelus australis]|uniref:Uncharacterized protein n=1 Tax=Dryococelus australis TaxID=614101 RepID=A0ABQ9GR69_9NEOP|nr:hypothetical protein PR048_025418 [Dryococelus australis]